MSLDLTLDFFFTYQRAEFALKNSDFLQDKNDGRKALASWKEFARSDEVRAVLENPQEDDLKAAIAYYFAEPPRDQIVLGGVPAWKDRDAVKDGSAEDLLDLVRITRNNLFHGGKRSPELMRPRDLALVQHGLTIVRASIYAHPRVLQAFDSYDKPAQ